MSKAIEYKRGQKLGTCIYLHDVEQTADSRRALFQCLKCGKEFEAEICKIKSLNTKSCGCLKINGPNKFKHHLSYHPLYNKWYDIKRRCYDKRREDYSYYGGRGITMCDEWRNDVKAFYDYVIKLSHYDELGMTLDRINNDGNYEPGNLRWTTRRVQTINRGKQKSNTSGFVGVGYHKLTKRWIVYITVNYKQTYIGLYDNVKKALKARNDYIIEHGLTEYALQ